MAWPRWWLLVPVAVWLLAAVLLGGSPAAVVPPLLLLVLEAQLVGGWVPGSVALAAAWSGLGVWQGFHPVEAYGALALAVALAALQASGARLRRAPVEEAGRGHDADAAPPAGLAPAAGPRARGRGQALPADGRDDADAGLALWRTDGGGPELLAGGTGPVDAATVATVARDAAAAHREVRQTLPTKAGPRYLEAFPASDRDDVGLVMTAVRDAPLPQADRILLATVAAIFPALLTRLNEARSGRLVLALVQRSLGGIDGEPVETALLDLVLAETSVRSGAVLRCRAGRFVAEATAGEPTAPLGERLQQGFDYGDSPVWTVRREARPVYVTDCREDPATCGAFAELGVRALALVPVGRDSGGEEAVLALFHDAPRAWPERLRLLLDSLCSVLRAALVQRDSELRLSEMVRLQRELLETPLASMYQRALEAAIRMVPAAEAGSLLVRGQDGDFRYVAAAGFSLAGLADLRLSIDAMRIWHGDDGTRWAAGEPRVLVSTQRRSVGDVSALTTPREQMREAGRVDEIVANLCLPIIYRDEVLAVLNLDSLHDPMAFGAAAARAATDVAPVIGFLLHESEARARLDRVARTDELTGLGNRRAFNERAVAELAKAARYEHELTVLVMDLTNFKALNDSYGHAAGDDALRAVAGALRDNLRASDEPFRWGGDEFAALLPYAGMNVARVVAGRIAEAVARLDTPGPPLRTNVGGACAPADGRDLDALLTRADNRMYRAKALGRTWVEADESS